MLAEREAAAQSTRTPRLGETPSSTQLGDKGTTT
jgi:hypothetical protein